MSPNFTLSWLRSASVLNISSLPTSANTFIWTYLPHIAEDAANHMAIVARVTYAATISPEWEQIRREIQRASPGPIPSIAQIDTDLIRPLTEWFYSFRLRAWPHWALVECSYDLQIAVVMSWLASGMSISRIRELIQTHLWIEEGDLWVDVIKKAQTFLNRPGTPPSYNSDKVRDIEALVRDHTIMLQPLSHIEIVPGHITWIANLVTLRKRIAPKNTPTARLIRALIREINDWMTPSTFLETYTVNSLSEGGATPRTIASRWRPIMVEGSGPLAPYRSTTDGIHSVPDWIITRVCGLGARFMHLTVGPLPYWFIALERAVPGTHPKVGFPEPEVGDGSLRFDLYYFDDDNHPLCARFEFPLDGPSNIADLAYIVAVGSIRIDFFVLSPKLRFLRSLHWNVPAKIIATIEEVLAAQLESRWHSNCDDFLAARIAAQMPVYPLAFMSWEWAKAEDIVEETALTTWFTESPDRTSAWSEYCQMRRRWLEREAMETKCQFSIDAARWGDAQVDTATARTDFLRARDRLRHDHPKAFDALRSESRMRRIQGVLRDHEAFVHFGLVDGGIHASVLTHAGPPEYHFVMHAWQTPSLLRLLRSLSSSSIQSNPERLFEAVSVARDAFQEFLSGLKSSGIFHLVLSPCAELDLLPIHCIPADSSGRPAFMVFDSVTYCVSALLYSDCVRRPAVTLEASANVTSTLWWGGLAGMAHAKTEGELIGQIWPTGRRWAGYAATPDRFLKELRNVRLLNLICHGDAAPGSPLRGAWELYAPVRHEGILTAPGLLMEPPCTSRAEVVLLSLCSGGQHWGESSSPHLLSAMDSMLLRLGVRAVTSALWPIADNDAMMFSVGFNVALSKGATVAEAHRQGIRAQLTDEGTPRGGAVQVTPKNIARLAAFRVVGDGTIRIA